MWIWQKKSNASKVCGGKIINEVNKTFNSDQWLIIIIIFIEEINFTNKWFTKESSKIKKQKKNKNKNKKEKYRLIYEYLKLD